MPLDQKCALTNKILFHMLGLQESNALRLQLRRSMTPNSVYHLLATTIDKYDASDSPHETMLILRDIADRCTSILLPSRKSGLPRLALEQGKNDDLKKGFSRNPFIPVPPRYIPDIALGAACYLLRGYCRFFYKPRHQRGFNTAKSALNDIHQAFQLNWRLYHSLTCSHHISPDNNLEMYYKSVIMNNPSRTLALPPGISPYYTWQMFVLCDIMRGNIYRQIDYLEEADRHYRHCETRFIDLCSFAKTRGKDLFEPIRARWFITGTMIKALHQRSKVRFDLGQFLESLITQIQCLKYLVCLGRSELYANSHSITSVRRTFNLLSAGLTNKLDHLLGFLDAERSLPVLDRRSILYHFGDPYYKSNLRGATSNTFTLDDLRKFCLCISPDSASLAAQVLARIGFTLYTLRPKQIHDMPVKNKWMKAFFRFDQSWFEIMGTRIQPSHLGCYCDTFYSTKMDDASSSINDSSQRSGQYFDDIGIFDDEIERKFALLLRRAPSAGPSDVTSSFYREILEATTENIANIITIPRRNRSILMRRGYKDRRTKGDMQSQGIKSVRDLNKLVVLRRWQSYNPKIPRPSARRLLGGGYFLLWQGKGFVIDPGYDFVQNFYDEGFSLADIDAVIITHSHPDHDDDLPTLTTLVKEWNEYHYKIGLPGLVRRLDIFLNESTHKKFSSWLQASKVKIGRVIPLPIVCWDRETKRADQGPARGHNVVIDLRQLAVSVAKDAPIYQLKIEIIPAWHDDVIGRTAAIGLKFHLYRDNAKAGVIGYTGDTGAYGKEPQLSRDRQIIPPIENQYKGCDILIAHLGDIRIREISTAIESVRIPESGTAILCELTSLLEDWFGKAAFDSRNGHTFSDRVRDFLYFTIALDLIPDEALKAELPPDHTGHIRRVQEWLGKYLDLKDTGASSRAKTKELYPFDISPRENILLTLYKAVVQTVEHPGKSVDDYIEGSLSGFYAKASNLRVSLDDQRAYLLLAFLIHCARTPWKYPYHLGIHGTYRLFNMMNCYWKGTERQSKLFILGELPEELSSYRQKIASLLNKINFPSSTSSQEKPVKAFTGDIGLHIDLSEPSKPKVRCAFCNYNNELALKKLSYHNPADMVEVSIKRHGGAMLYLCRDHYPGDPTEPQYFLNRPYLRVI